MGFNDKFAILVRFGSLLPFTCVTSTRNSNSTVGVTEIEVRGLADRSPSGRQRSDFMSFQTSIISLVLPPCLPSGAPPRAPWKRQTVQPFKPDMGTPSPP